MRIQYTERVSFDIHREIEITEEQFKKQYDLSRKSLEDFAKSWDGLSLTEEDLGEDFILEMVESLIKIYNPKSFVYGIDDNNVYDGADLELSKIDFDITLLPEYNTIGSIAHIDDDIITASKYYTDVYEDMDAGWPQPEQITVTLPQIFREQKLKQILK